ncbi:MAG: phosphotransferase [Nakamurella sp.]
MHSVHDVRAGDALADHLHDAPWMDATGRAAVGFTVIDRIHLGRAPEILVVQPWHAPDRRYAVPVGVGDVPLADGAIALADLDARLVDATRVGRLIPTPGGAVVLHGDPPPYRAAVPFDSGWSTNAVSALDLDGVLHIHKRYRVLTTDVHEPVVLARLQGTESVPDHVANWAWVDPTGAECPLGVLYRHVDGEPLEDLLRVNLRTLWPPLSFIAENFKTENGTINSAVVTTQHFHELAVVLRAVGAAIRGLHRALVAHVAPRGTYDVGPCLERTRTLLVGVLDQLNEDEHLPLDTRQAVAAALREKVAALPALLAATPPPPLTAGVGHGDLHLSHLLCRASAGGGWMVSAIDISSGVINPDAPGFASQTPWQDLVAVRRGLESFAGHEAAVQDAEVLGIHYRESSLAAVLGASGSAPTDPASSAKSGRLFAAADLWSERAFRLVLDGYGEADLLPALHPLWQLLHTNRMLHELDYNLTRGRAHQVNLDVRRALTPDDLVMR